MKESTFKIVVLALLVVVFTAVVITARWADQSNYNQISCPSPYPDEASSQDLSDQRQTGDLSAREDTDRAESEAGSAVSWTDLNGYSREKVQQPVDSARQAANRNEEPDDGAEPPDDSKDTYGADDVE